MQSNGISQRILEHAVMYLTQWENKNISLDNCLDHLRKNSDHTERSAVASLLFEYFRHKSFIDGLIRKYARKNSIAQEIRLLISCAATQAFFQQGIVKQSAVNVAVDTAKKLRGKSCGGFVNAMLRSMLRDTGFDHDHIPPSFPDILKERWAKAFSDEELQTLLNQYASNPPLTFRARIPVQEQQLNDWQAEKIPVLDFLGAFNFYQTCNQNLLFKNTDWQEQQIYIQDPATCMPFFLLQEVPSGKVLDACSAPGGKTILLYDLCQQNNSPVQITASDRSEARIRQLKENLQRAAIPADIVQADAAKLPFEEASFDWIIADVPCSNTGVIRRRPDAPWRFTEKRLREIVNLQKEILESLQKHVRPGGFLLYATCSIEADENDTQIRNFMERHPDFVLKQKRLLLPSEFHDGAFAALLQKN